MTKPNSIPEFIRGRFDQVCKAAKNGDLALVSALTVEGEQVYLMTATYQSEPEADFVCIPFGHFVCPDDPYEAYNDPTMD